jgi:hypothetical protein
MDRYAVHGESVAVNPAHTGVNVALDVPLTLLADRRYGFGHRPADRLGQDARTSATALDRTDHHFIPRGRCSTVPDERSWRLARLMR